MMCKAFTLIELLVVITIIVVLLALLTPALDRAIYQAELVVCATTTGTIARTGIVYGSNNRRRYPHRDGMEGADVEQNRLNVPYPYWDPPADMRPILADYLAINASFNDVITGGPVDFKGSDEDTVLMASYYYYFSWQFEYEGQNLAGMFKLGDRFSWSWDYDNDGERETFRFDLLASDWTTTQENDHAFANHPDFDGVLRYGEVQDSPVSDIFLGTSVGEGPLKYTQAVWSIGNGVHERGPLDMNFAHADGSVSRITEVTWDEGIKRENGEGGRTVRVPRAGNSGSWPDDFSDLPKAN